VDLESTLDHSGLELGDEVCPRMELVVVVDALHRVHKEELVLDRSAIRYLAK
jgi:hypothetical protein